MEINFGHTKLLFVGLFLMAMASCSSSDDDDDYYYQSEDTEESTSGEEEETDDGIDKTTYVDYATLFEGNGSDRWYRIPGIVVTKAGTILAYCEERTSTSDQSDMNITCRRSTDNGETWEDAVTLADGISTSHTMNNPVMIADDQGGVHFLHCIDYGTGDIGGLYYRYSDDDGITWSDEVDLTEFTNPDEWFRIASGPGHGIQHSNGTLISPIWRTDPEEEESGLGSSPDYYGCATMYSEDYGATWQIGEVIKSSETVSGPNEPTIAELSDGTLLMNCRTKSQSYRAVTYSNTGYDGWTDLVLDENLPCPKCYGSILSTGDALLFVNPDSQTARENITVKISYDDGQSWSALKLVQEEVSMGYADLAINDDGQIFVLYESTESTEEVSSIYSLKLCRFYIDYVEEETTETEE